MHIVPRIGTECPTLLPDLPFDPQFEKSLDVSRVEVALQNSDVKVSRVFVTYKGSETDKVLHRRLPSEITESSRPKYVLLRNPSQYPDGKKTIIGQVVITTLGDCEPVFVTYNSCTASERAWILQQLPKQENSCILY